MKQTDKIILLDNLNWCLKNNYNISLSNKEKYSKAVYYLMNSKDKIGFWTESEIKLMIVFFAYDFASKFKIENKVKLEFLSKKVLSSDTMATCHDNLDGTYLVQFSYKVIEGFLKGKEAPLYSIQTVFHEMAHIIQNELVKGNFLQKEDNYYSSKTYIMVLELLARKVDKNFYNVNYSKLFKENHANKVGLQFALAYLKKYGPTFYSTYNKDIMLLRMKYYDKMMNNSKIVIYDKEQDIFKGLDTLTFFYIQNNKAVLEKYPILKLAYNSDGSKKNILQLLEDREKMLSKEEEKIVNELYEILANKKILC